MDGTIHLWDEDGAGDDGDDYMLATASARAADLIESIAAIEFGDVVTRVQVDVTAPIDRTPARWTIGFGYPQVSRNEGGIGFSVGMTVFVGEADEPLRSSLEFYEASTSFEIDISDWFRTGRSSLNQR